MTHVCDSGEGSTAPLVSFLTSAYRTERYVSETIESVLAQTRGDWELIVVDNGNSDEMARIVRNYTSDPRITLIRQENKGVQGGVSAAAAVAVGHYFCVLNSDDTLDPHYCERIGALTEDDPGIDAVGCNAVLFWDPDADGVQKPREYFASNGRKTTPDPSRTVSFTELVDEGVPPYAGTIRREAWDAHGGYEPSADVEADVALWLRLVAAGHEVRILPDKLVRIRIRPDSTSRDPSNIDAFLERFERAFLLVGREQGLSESAMAATGMLRRLRYTISLHRARSALLAGDVQVARTAARDAFQQRRTVRAAAVFAGLRLSPGLLAAIHPAKNRVEDALRRARFRESCKRQVEDPTQPAGAGPRTPRDTQA
jgi:glycosyltransferase involved in cell wall biosynthesis